jgi:hypothetical protein
MNVHNKKTITTKQKGLDYIKQLNSLKILKANKIIACGEQYCLITKQTWCELYNRSNKKRVRINTTVLFAIPEFIVNPEKYIHDILILKSII